MLKKNKSYWKQYKEWYENNPRGYGFWLWKPYLIERELKKLEYGDVLVYLDAGCVINAMGKNRYRQYLDMLSDESPIICFEHTNCFEKQYCKSELLAKFDLLGDTVFLQSRQKMATLMFLRKCQISLEFLHEWSNICHCNHSLIDDRLSSLPEHSEFKEHRHDQSVFSCLCWKYGIEGLPQYEVYPTPCNWESMDKYPFWAARRKEFAKPSIFERIIRKLKSFA